MAHYAFLDDNNVVTEIITGIDETELIEGLDTETWYGNFRGQVCKRTSYNHRIRGRFAVIGGTFDVAADRFVSLKPYPSWILDGDHDWVSPVSRPLEGIWGWDEESLSWLPPSAEMALLIARAP